MSILARSTLAPSGNSPARMRANRSRFSATLRLRKGLSWPGEVRVPRFLRISSALWSSTVGQALLDELHRKLVEFLEIVRGEKAPFPPGEAQPHDVFLNGVDVLLLFFGGVGVVEAQVAGAAVFLGHTEIEADGLGVADVQISVGFGRKARGRGRTFAGTHVGLDDGADKVFVLGLGSVCHGASFGVAMPGARPSERKIRKNPLPVKPVRLRRSRVCAWASCRTSALSNIMVYSVSIGNLDMSMETG